VKPLDKFSKLKDGKFGRNSKCKDCKSKYSKKRYAKPEVKAAQKKSDDKRKADPVRNAAWKESRRKLNTKYRQTPETLLPMLCDTRIGMGMTVSKSSWGAAGRTKAESTLRLLFGIDTRLDLTKAEKNKYWSFYVTYIEARWYGGMSWNNRPKGNAKHWVIDHIRPICSFDLNDPEERKKAFHYTNTQSLLWAHNREKEVHDLKWDEATHPLRWDGKKWVPKRSGVKRKRAQATMNQFFKRKAN
jgi:hypothetical protein